MLQKEEKNKKAEEEEYFSYKEEQEIIIKIAHYYDHSTIQLLHHFISNRSAAMLCQLCVVLVPCVAGGWFAR